MKNMIHRRPWPENLKEIPTGELFVMRTTLIRQLDRKIFESLHDEMTEELKEVEAELVERGKLTPQGNG